MAWIFIPSTSLASAPAEVDSISESNWRFQVLALSAWSRGKPTRSIDWYRRWRKSAWLQHLCSRMSSPSTADAGADAWMRSLAASRVRRIPSPARSSDPTTLATSGRRPGASSSSPGHGASSSRTSLACSAPAPTKSLAQPEYGETYAGWVARLRLDSSRRQKLARRTNASASSSSDSTPAGSLSRPIWPTPDAGLLNDREEPGTFLERQRHHASKMNPTRAGLTLAIAAKMFPTPSATDGERSGVITDQMTGTSLAQFVRTDGKQWSTPSANDGLRGADPVRRDTGKPNASLKTDIAAWPTPAVRDYKGANSADHLTVGTGALHLDQLPNFVAHIWSTPRVSQGGYTRDKGKKGAERLTLEGEAEVWSTPSVASSEGGQRSRSGKRQSELLLGGQADSLSGHLDPTTSTAGDRSLSPLLMLYRRYRGTTCSVLRSERRALLLMAIRQRGRGWTRRQASPRIRPSFRRQLNPTFVYWLMGWKTGSTASGLVEMGSYQWKQAWRSELLATALVEPPAQQLNLFGI